MADSHVVAFGDRFGATSSDWPTSAVSLKLFKPLAPSHGFTTFTYTTHPFANPHGCKDGVYDFNYPE